MKIAGSLAKKAGAPSGAARWKSLMAVLEAMSPPAWPITRGLKRVQVVLAWLHAKPVISAPIVGVTDSTQLDDVLSSLSVELSLEEIEQLEQLEQPYGPHAIAGH